jgi:SAM-dependent methyltransferase
MGGSDYPSPLKLDLACGQRKLEGFLGVDIAGDADIVHDLESYPWPFEDNSVDAIHISRFIEHVDDLIAFMNEVHRVMKPGARCYIRAPYYTSIGAWQDPTHKRAISENTFVYFNRGWRERNHLDHYDITADFDFNYRFDLYDEWRDKPPEELRFAIKHYCNIIREIRVVLIKRSQEVTTAGPDG